MESQPQNAEFRIYPENFHPCTYKAKYGLGLWEYFAYLCNQVVHI